MYAELNYKTEAEVSSIVRRFWTTYFSVCLFIVLISGVLFYQKNDKMFVVACGLLCYSLIAAAIIRDAFFDLSKRLVNGEKCGLLLQSMETHPQVAAYVQQVNTNRAVVAYDYLVVRRWVEKAKVVLVKEQEQLACKKIQGIA